MKPRMPEQLDVERYKALLIEALPAPIESEQEHERLLSLAEGFLEKGDAMRPEERKLAAMLVLLIEAYESQLDDAEEEEGDAEPPAPFETLKRLLTARQLEVDDIAHLFGNIHLAREALEGRRAISGRQAKDLGKFFRVPPALFSR